MCECGDAADNGLLSRRDFLRTSAFGLMAAAVGQFPATLLSQSAEGDLKRIYLAPDDHTDLFWTANEATYRDSFLRMIDYYLDLADTTADLASDFQSRWNCDGSFWLWTYEQNRTPAQFLRLMERVRDGHITAPLNALVTTPGGSPTEAVIRGMYYPGKLERRHNVRFHMAISMENTTLPLGLISLWAGAGAKYSWKGICGCDTVLRAGMREHEIYWAAGVDGERVLMKWNSILVDNKHMGGYAEARDPAAVVEFVDSDPRFLARYPYRVIGAFGKGWDDLETLTDEFVRIAQEKTDANRRVIVSNQQDFFIDFHDTYGAEIPQVAVSFGNDWDLYCAALAEVSAQIKRSTEKLRTAEALATLVTTFSPGFMQGREAVRDQAWMNLGLYWEHNFGLAGRDNFRNERIAWQRRLAAEIADYVETLERDAINAIGDVIAQPEGAVQYAVFNPLNWIRTDVVDLPYEETMWAQVIDLSTGQEVPAQFIKEDGKTYFRIIAQDVPGTGYKVYEIAPKLGTEFTTSVTVGENVLENEYYRLTVTETGAITSMIDKRAGNRECVQFINNLAANDLGGTSGRLSLESVGAVSATLVATSSSPVAHTSRITLFRQIDRVDICNTITQNFDDILGWAFSFQTSQPDLWHEEVGALLLAKLVEEGGHYASQNARYDWLTLNHFADMGGAGEGITLSNADCYFFRYGNSTADQLDTATPQLTVLAGGRVGGDGRFGIPNQGGDTQFLQRFALRSRSSYDPASAMRFALEHQNPLVAIPVTGEQPKLSDSQFTLCSLSNPNIIVWALKPADDIGGTVIRLWNMASTPQPFDLGLQDVPIQNAFRVTHIETILEPIQVSEGGFLSDELGAFQMRSYAINVDTAL